MCISLQPPLCERIPSSPWWLLSAVLERASLPSPSTAFLSREGVTGWERAPVSGTEDGAEKNEIKWAASLDKRRAPFLSGVVQERIYCTTMSFYLFLFEEASLHYYSFGNSAGCSEVTACQFLSQTFWTSTS